MKRCPALLCAFLWSAFAQDAVPSAETLLRRAVEAEKAQDAKGWKFTWREDEDKLPVDKNGKPLTPSHRTFENIMLEGDNYRKLILIDGKPPDAKLQRKIDAEMEKEKAARRAHPEIKRHEVRLGGLEQTARMFDSRVTGEESVSGRMTWRIESLPKPDYKPANTEEERVLAMRRVTWVDELEGMQIRFLVIVLRPSAGFQPGSEFETDFGKHEGAWLMDRFDMRYNAKVYSMVHLRGESSIHCYDYKKFAVESKITVQ